MSFSKLYEQGALEVVSKEYGYLLNQDPLEELVQNFLKENPILLQIFSPEQIFFKKPILSKYKTDIVILTHSKELLLIEIEKPGTKILRKDGGNTAALQHAIKQVNDWLHEAEHHHDAVLDCIGLKSQDVTVIRGAVIVGREASYPAEHFHKLKWTDFGRNIEFLTFDDLQRSLVNLIGSIKKL